MEEMDPKELGTLIVVVGKARNLPNKSRFGKQDPFCTVQVLEEKKRTKTIKRGGQHPEWDDELRFTIWEELEDILKVSRSESLADSTMSSSASLASVASNSSPGVTTAQALAAKSRKPLKKGGGKNMRVACYADDPKEPELIGDCYVQIDDVLKKGEVDEWYEFTYKEKYVGEIYLELTFYSNDAPPVKRNVPKPATHNYGGAGVLHDGNMSTSSSLSGRLSTSGSASGMNLYIPPYAAQHAVAPPPQPYGSFGNLGLPPSMSESQDFAPGPSASPAPFAPAVVPSATLPSIDSLARPFSSMSLGAPATPPSSIAPSASTMNIHRQSVGVSDAPWQSLLPQSQPTVSAPHSRPMSTNDALPWEQAKRLEDERRRGGATPVPKLVSGQGFGTPPAGFRPGDTVPAALQAGSPIRHQHAHSFSYTDRPVVTSLLHSTSPSPAPLATSAPQQLPNNQYQQSPLSSFERVALALNTSQSSIGQSPLSSRRQSVHDPLQTPLATYQPTPTRVAQDYPAPSSAPASGTPTRVNAYQQLYGQDATSATPPQPFAQSQPHTPQTHPHLYHSHSEPQPQSNFTYDTPPAQPTPPPAQQYATPSGSYVPSYQQTQSSQSSGPSVPARPDTTTPAPYADTPPRPAFGPPPVPSRRPVPTPPGPPGPAGPGPGRGYYPSDELYIRSSNELSEVYSSPSGPSHTPQAGSIPSPGPSQYNAPYRPYHEDQTYRKQSYNEPTYQNNNVPHHSFSPPPLPTHRPDITFVDRSTTPLGVPQNPPLRSSTPLGDPPQGLYPGPGLPMRSTTPVAPGQPQKYRAPQIYPEAQQPYSDYARGPSPAPPQPYTPPPLHPYAQSQVPPLPPARGPSPLPPPQRYDQTGMNASPHTPTHLGPLPPAKSPLVNHHQSFPPAPEPQANRASWKDYMRNLPTSSAVGAINGVSGATGVAPPDSSSGTSGTGPWDGDTQYGDARMPGGFGAATAASPIQAKPPRPDGWRSTLPAQVNGHKWGA